MTAGTSARITGQARFKKQGVPIIVVLAAIVAILAAAAVFLAYIASSLA